MNDPEICPIHPRARRLCGDCPACLLAWDRDNDLRVRAVGIADGNWPYGPNIDIQSRERLLSWAIVNCLKEARPNARCLHWLVGKVRHCSARRDSFDHPGVVNRWGDRELDHPTYWTRNGKPALILAQPYQMPGAEWAQMIESNWPVKVELADRGPWYGFGTYGVFITPDDGGSS